MYVRQRFKRFTGASPRGNKKITRQDVSGAAAARIRNYGCLATFSVCLSRRAPSVRKVTMTVVVSRQPATTGRLTAEIFRDRLALNARSLARSRRLRLASHSLNNEYPIHFVPRSRGAPRNGLHHRGRVFLSSSPLCTCL